MKRLIALTGSLVVLFLLQGSHLEATDTPSHGVRRVVQTPIATVATITTPVNKPKTTGSGLLAYYAAQLDTLPIAQRPGDGYKANNKPTPAAETRCKADVYKTLNLIPQTHQKQLSELTLFYTRDGRRGLGGNGSVILRCLNVTDSELSSVLMHEMGHLVDEGLLRGSETDTPSGFYDFNNPVAADDPSLIFYNVSWISDKKIKSVATKFDFVSLYAMTDPFEDFAETYTYYRLHGPEFRVLMQSDESLAQKYNFMRIYVFGGTEYGTTVQNASVDSTVRNYDVTVLPITS